MFGIAPFSAIPLSSLPDISITSTLKMPVETLVEILKANNIPVEVRANEILVNYNVPVEIISQQTVPISLKWVLSSRGTRWVLDPNTLTWTLDDRTSKWVVK